MLGFFFLALIFISHHNTQNRGVALSSHCTTHPLAKTFKKSMNLPTQQACIAWTFHPHTATLHIVFFGTFISPSGWVGWGINPNSPQMTGTRALIAFSDPTSGKILLLPYTLDPDVKLQKTPLLSRHNPHLISSSVVLSGTAVRSGAQVQIFATLKLIPNTTQIHCVWNRGVYVQDRSPTIHPTTPSDLASASTIDLLSGAEFTTKRTMRAAHGTINALAWGVLLPLGALGARYLRHFSTLGAVWFYAHAAIQVTAFIAGIVGFALGIRLGEESSSGGRTSEVEIHRRLGFAVVCLGSVQTVALVLRPKRTNKYKKYWKSYHHLVGYGCVVVGVVNCFQGFGVMEETGSGCFLAYCLALATIIGACVVLEVNSWVIFCRNAKEEDLKRRHMINSDKASAASHI